jgi:transcription elongation factor GreA
VRFGTTVVLEDTDSGEEVSYTLVGEDESDVAAGLISVASPVARALLGKGEGEEVKVRVPKGTRTFEVLSIRYD